MLSAKKYLNGFEYDIVLSKWIQILVLPGVLTILKILLNSVRKMNSPVAAKRAMFVLMLTRWDKTTIAELQKAEVKMDEAGERPEAVYSLVVLCYRSRRSG